MFLRAVWKNTKPLQYGVTSRLSRLSMQRMAFMTFDLTRRGLTSTTCKDRRFGLQTNCHGESISSMERR
jgi:hypothetical protein